MRYQAPVNADDPNDPYVDRDTPNAQRGSAVPAKAVEHPQREIAHVIAQAGLTPSEFDTTQLWQALQRAIEQGFNTRAGYSSLRPEIVTANNKFTFSWATGLFVFPDSGIVLHRGGAIYDMADFSYAARAFNTAPNKRYHARMRFNVATRAATLHLFDLADVNYKPASTPEFNATYDSFTDDMLAALVETDASNNITVTAFRNRFRLVAFFSKGSFETGAVYPPYTTIALDWANQPNLSWEQSSVLDGSNNNVAMQRCDVKFPKKRTGVEVAAHGVDLGTGNKIAGSFVVHLSTS